MVAQKIGSRRLCVVGVGGEGEEANPIFCNGKICAHRQKSIANTQNRKQSVMGGQYFLSCSFF